MIGPLHLAQVTTHIGYSPLCFCCCDDVPQVEENLGGSQFGTPEGLNPFVTQTPSETEPSPTNPLSLAQVLAEQQDRVNKYLNSDTIAPRRNRSGAIEPLDYKLKKATGIHMRIEEDEFILAMIIADESDDCEVCE